MGGARGCNDGFHEILQPEAYHSSLPPPSCGMPGPVLAVVAIVIIIAVRREEESILLIVIIVIIVGLFEESVER